ncbi:MAG: UDP-N-acetylmuramoyl-tripeptide--D-alanyl-D-alanine ligase [Brevundimonas sp.]|jgi:UDP-N-acetylmuramoyl-tripeptide--D-alanyl-D-alanine ligase|uniref:UDP-N-acetylmuramoyl-tripeptide--D-alanyl-D- alanine ligase n=1 Tax=Brevundimonas sp. GW460-12-10-14-LB2 TaxID=1827469 RepID=UPI0007BC9FEB|nr:UDP-N-acetylmuramoyl-tripeptide--D-alanyl-D-alanine ligase [Brevundimonas sp. GW460-12-10-14-LB2]ANC52474.1 UDP-N-acetylmuramoylalanyl-D-glutamyl-2, 6-diaminopimelate--D-alanyl-D-alanine ligase [Brevundimonas sp. GW460-12-10-14-LB2]MEA3472620.1 UDP-N-acetylmuramoyl-tripeptide--D-alanyl-D-alanine ligase [Pseudomonadota bacterium]
MPENSARPLWSAAEVAAATGGVLHGDDRPITGLTYNSREIVPGDLFLALKGERDGHQFASGAFASGAAAALVEHPVEGGPCVVVPDTLRGLEALGVAARERAPHVKRGAVTGSVGKTSVTQAIKAGLDLAGPAHGSIKSYNNHIGVPLTLARMPVETQRAVFEIGMNAPGEIAPLSRFVAPHAACVTTVGPVHIEAFADGEAGVAREKATIFQGLVPGGAAVANGDVAFSAVLCDAAKAVGARLLTFGSDAGHDARLLDFRPDAEGAAVAVELFGRRIDYRLAQSGAHWGLNSLCVLLMLDALDVTLDTGLEALAGFQPLAGRGQTRTVTTPDGAFTLIDESYNANPLSMAAGFKTLGARSTSGRRVVVLTDMLELGEQSRDLHEGLAGPIDAAGLDLVHAAGPEMRWLYDALPVSRRGVWRATAAELAAEAALLVAPGDIVMVKGSNGSKASLVAKALAELQGRDTTPATR